MMFRPLTGEDVAAIAGIERELFAREAWSLGQVEDELSRVGQTRWYLGAESGGQLVGYVGLYVLPPDADVQTIAVCRASQGAGLGRALLTAAVDHARSAGCRTVFLEVRADNNVALALYESSGFERTGCRPRYYVDGTDALTMRLRLPSSDPAPGGRDE